ncbi:acetate non-utilizing protein [Nadsonia fulvescens var. elongata DSM 6958]|uniref:Succinate dehydrogenase assembly factor 3 n=1 Tax=Nadsonia fulvescens var. elongata DSM 6958 TaxID=857566 RepID=A0A1E3PTJ6_9ASCO|nr:acetate non-utilizing protein [Nadsonia fulvescens var. elongata DSM 6958]
MKFTTKAMADAFKITPRAPRKSFSPILPPIALYRRILRAHSQHLPLPQRLLGDQYVSSEFRLHRSMDNPSQIVAFLSTWQKYVASLEADNWKHESLDWLSVSKLNNEQVIQLYELMQAAKGENSEYQIDEKASPDAQPELPAWYRKHRDRS